LLASYIAAASQYVEGYTGARLITQTLRLTFDQFPDRLPVYPVQSITSIVYDDEEQAEQTLDSSAYYTSLDGMSPRIAPVDAWPAVSQEKPGAVRITLVAGFSSAPAQLKAGVLILVKEMYANRGESDAGAPMMPTTFAAHRLLKSYKRISL
jgi:uncharacterized phiE125 gp8 family phage protein